MNNINVSPLIEYKASKEENIQKGTDNLRLELSNGTPALIIRKFSPKSGEVIKKIDPKTNEVVDDNIEIGFDLFTLNALISELQGHIDSLKELKRDVEALT